MRPLRYSINVTLDGCCDHSVMNVDEQMFRYHTANLQHADALLFGRTTYQMMEDAWRTPGPGPDWMTPFVESINRTKKYVVSSTLTKLDWNAELLDRDLGSAVRALKQQPGNGLLVGGLTLPRALAELGLIDEYDFVVHPIIAGHGPTLFAGLSKRLALELVSRVELGGGTVAMRYAATQP